MTLFVAKISSSPTTAAIGHLFGRDGFSSTTITGGADVAIGVAAASVGSGSRVLVAVGLLVRVADGVMVKVGLGVWVAPKAGLGKLLAGKVDVGVKVKVLVGGWVIVGVKVDVFVGVSVKVGV
jgi:hypothetical protein